MKKIFLYILFFVCIICKNKNLFAQVTYDISVQKLEFINPATQTTIQGNPVVINNTLPQYQIKISLQATGILPITAPDSIATTLTILHPNGTSQLFNKKLPIILPNQPISTVIEYFFENNDTTINGANTFAFSVNADLQPTEESDYTNNGAIQAAYINAYIIPLAYNYNELITNKITIFPAIINNTNALYYNHVPLLATLQIFDNLGQLITQTSVEKNGNIPLPYLPKGMYFVQIKNENAVVIATQKILKF